MGAVKQKHLADAERCGYDSWHELAVELQDKARSRKEQDFVDHLIKLTASGRVPTAPQQAWLRDIYERWQESLAYDDALYRD